MRRVTCGLALLVLASACAPAPPPERALPVHFVASTPAGERLYRELRTVTTDDPGSAAVTAALGAPLDPDYRTPWPPGTALRIPVAHADTVVTVDLTGLDRLPDGLAVAQLVATAQDALDTTDPVRILLDGRPTGPAVPRGDDVAQRSLVQIDTPGHGAAVGREVAVAGEAAVFEATVRWSVLRDGTVVRSGSTSTSEGQRFSPYRFTVMLDPGTYTVRVAEDDPSDGEGRPPLTDDKVIIVG